MWYKYPLILTLLFLPLSAQAIITNITTSAEWEPIANLAVITLIQENSDNVETLSITVLKEVVKDHNRLVKYKSGKGSVADEYWVGSIMFYFSSTMDVSLYYKTLADNNLKFIDKPSDNQTTKDQALKLHRQYVSAIDEIVRLHSIKKSN